MAKRNNKIIFGAIGFILILSGMTMSIPVLLNREYLVLLPFAGLSVIIGVLLIAWMFSEWE